VVEQVIRPTGLVDPIIHVKSARGQVTDLITEIQKRTANKERTLVTTLTKRLAEDLSNYFIEVDSSANGCTRNSTPSSASKCCANCAKGLRCLGWRELVA